MAFQPNPDIYLSERYLVLDVEVEVRDGRFGSAMDKRNQLALACWRGAGETESHWGGEFDQERLAEAISKCDFIVAHHTKYELGWLSRMGVDTSSIPVFDTLLAEYVLAGNLASTDEKTGLPPLSLSLDTCCRRRGMKQKDKVVDLWMKEGIPVSDMPRKWVEDRCRQDVETTEQLFLSQRRALSLTNRLAVLYTRCALTPVLVDMESQGVCLDPSRVDAAFVSYTERLQTLEAQMSSMTGGINWRSSKQAGEFIYDTLGFKELRDRRGEPKRTASGSRATDQKTLQLLSAETAEQREFLELRRELGKTSAALSKNLTYFQHACEHSEGIFHAQFNQAVTATHRLSSSGLPTVAGSVQFQNLPRAFKPLFRAREAAWRIMEIDGAQLEFRVAAQLGGDRQAIADIADPEFDAHLTTASYMFQKPYEELLARYRAGDKKVGELRTQAKPETFKPLFGGSKGTAAQERWYKGFRERYKDLAKVQEGWVSAVRKDLRLVTPWGLRYYWPRAKVSNSGYLNVTASVYNYPIQGFATAEIIPIALVGFWHATSLLRSSHRIRIVNTVHDSVVVEYHPDVEEELKQIALDNFGRFCYDYLQNVYNYTFDKVPLGVGIKCGEFLGEGVEEAFNIYQNGKVEKLK